MTTPTERPVTPGKRKAPASAAKAAARELSAVESAVTAPAPAIEAPIAESVAPIAESAVPAAAEPDAAATAHSPAPAAAPAETAEPATMPPAEPAAAIPDSVPSQPLTSEVRFMTTTPTFKGYDEIAAFGKANIDALIQANTVFTKGVEAISKEFIALTQSQLESAAAAAKAIFAARTLKDMVELNAEFTKTNFDKMVANSTKLGELGTKVATDTFAPISARVTSVVEQAAKPSV